ncbi:MBOAT family protein [Aphelenchoides bicaudatus]|nr:MBOAT family protein [Aphelenchoides bicaudatus]
MYDLTDEQFENVYESEWNVAFFNVQQCVPAVLNGLLPLFLRLFGLTLLQTLIFRIKRHTFSNLVVAISAFYLLTYQLDKKWMIFIPILYYCISTIVDEWLMARKERGPVSIILAILYIVAWQAQLDAVYFMQIRGSLMIMAMKLISFAYENENCSITDKIAYIFNPSTVLFGPFINFKTFRKILLAPNNLFHAGFMSIIYAGLSVFCVLYSTCFAEIIPKSPELLGDYSAAQSYRFSHYFICYISLATILLSGITTSYQTTKLSAVEFPRSMGEVVVHWNYSMHEFLHKYVFKQLISYGYFVAIVGSFLMSSLLHGFNFQLTAVLISLAFYAYAENIFRSKLAQKLNACVKSRDCSDKCAHSNKKLSVLAFTINSLFMLLNIYHLIYLGMPFDGTAEEEGYSWYHTVRHWQRWNFSSHIISLAVLFLGFLI